MAATLTRPLSPSLGHTVRNGAQVPAPPRLPMHGTPLPTSAQSGCSPPVPQSFFRLTSPGWEAGETSAPSRPTPSRASSLARISLLTGWCVVLTGRGESGRQAKVEILDKLRATHRRLSLEADLRVATGATPCAADGPSAPFGARANAAAHGRAACGRARAFATAHVRVVRVLRMGLVGRLVDQHSTSPCASLCVLLALSRGGAGVVQCNTFGPVCRVHGRVSDCVGVHV